MTTSTHASSSELDSRLASRIARLRVYGFALVLAFGALCYHAVSKVLASPAWHPHARPAVELAAAPTTLPGNSRSVIPVAPERGAGPSSDTVRTAVAIGPLGESRGPVVPAADRSLRRAPFLQSAKQYAQTAIDTGVVTLANAGQYAESVMEKARRLSQLCEDRLSDGMLPSAVPDRLELVTPAKAAPATGLVLLNDREAGAAVRFVVNGRVHALGPGEKYESDSQEGAWLVQFHRGGSFGNAQYTLSAGTYVFRATERGWDLSLLSP